MCEPKFDICTTQRICDKVRNALSQDVYSSDTGILIPNVLNEGDIILLINIFKSEPKLKAGHYIIIRDEVEWAVAAALDKLDEMEKKLFVRDLPLVFEKGVLTVMIFKIPNLQTKENRAKFIEIMKSLGIQFWSIFKYQFHFHLM